MKVQSHSDMGTKGMTMLLDMLPSFLGSMLTAKPNAAKGKSPDFSGEASKLVGLCSTKKETAAPAGTVREGDELKQKQDVEVVKLKNAHALDSKKLDGEKSAFEGKQKLELQTFEKKHGKDKDVVAKRMKLIDKQAAEKAQFGKEFGAKKEALTKKYQEKYADQAKWHAMQKKELEGKYASTAKPTTVKPAAAKAAPKLSAAKPVAPNSSPIEEIAPVAGIPVAKIDGLKSNIVFIAA